MEICKCCKQELEKRNERFRVIKYMGYDTDEQIDRYGMDNKCGLCGSTESECVEIEFI